MITIIFTSVVQWLVTVTRLSSCFGHIGQMTIEEKLNHREFIQQNYQDGCMSPKSQKLSECKDFKICLYCCADGFGEGDDDNLGLLFWGQTLLFPYWYRIVKVRKDHEDYLLQPYDDIWIPVSSLAVFLKGAYLTSRKEFWKKFIWLFFF